MNLPACPACQLGAAGSDVYLFRGAKNSASVIFHLFEEDVARILRDPAQRGVANGTRLLIDFLEHEMLEAALFRHDRIPGDHAVPVVRLACHRSR